MQDGVDRPADVDILSDVGSNQPEAVVAEQMLDVSGSAGQEIVEAQHLETFAK
jgi:hypothetical protein